VRQALGRLQQRVLLGARRRGAPRPASAGRRERATQKAFPSCDRPRSRRRSG